MMRNSRNSRAERKPPAPKPFFRVTPFVNDEQATRFELLIRAIEHQVHKHVKYDVAMEAAALSEALSRSRGSTVRQEYLSEQLSQAAYCAHFLPWNIYRLLLAWKSSAPTILLSPEEGQERETFTVEDWGAGPMTGLLALWVAGGEELLKGSTYTAVEKQPDILNWGKRICRSLGIDKIMTVDARPDMIDLDDVRGGECDFLIVSNAFNEWLPPRGRSDESIRAFARIVGEALSPKGELSLMEPASRVVGWGVMTLRDIFIANDMAVLGPCTHHERCPLLDQRLKTWCHFRVPVELHPAHRGLADAMRIDRDTLSYSYLHISRVPDDNAPKQASAARVISDPLSLLEGRGVYACAPKGRVLLEGPGFRWTSWMREALAQDEKVLFRFPKNLRKDPKSKASRVPLDNVRRADGSKLPPPPRKPDGPSADFAPSRPTREGPRAPSRPDKKPRHRARPSQNDQ